MDRSWSSSEWEGRKSCKYIYFSEGGGSLEDKVQDLQQMWSSEPELVVTICYQQVGYNYNDMYLVTWGKCNGNTKLKYGVSSGSVSVDKYACSLTLYRLSATMLIIKSELT